MQGASVDSRTSQIVTSATPFFWSHHESPTQGSNQCRSMCSWISKRLSVLSFPLEQSLSRTSKCSVNWPSFSATKQSTRSDDRCSSQHHFDCRLRDDSSSACQHIHTSWSWSSTSHVALNRHFTYQHHKHPFLRLTP